MRRLIVSDTIRWSRDLYVEHLTGKRQYEAETRQDGLRAAEATTTNEASERPEDSPGFHPTVGNRGTPLAHPPFDPTSSPHSLPLRYTMAESRKILIPYPTPAVFTCPLCRVEFKQALKHLHIAKHMAEKHLGNVPQLVCAQCNSEFTNARSAGKHKCGGDSAPHNEVAEVTLIDESAIYAYPPGPSQCQLCSWASQAKDTAAITSVEKHLTRIHLVAKPKRRWRCRTCNTIADGIKMRTHV